MVIVDTTHHSFIDVITNSSTELFIVESKIDFVEDFVRSAIANSCDYCRKLEISDLEEYVHSLDDWDFKEYCTWVDRTTNEIHEIMLLREELEIPDWIENRDLVVINIDNNATDTIYALRKYFKIYEY